MIKSAAFEAGVIDTFEKLAAFGSVAEGSIKTIAGITKKRVGGKWVDHATKKPGFLSKLFKKKPEAPTKIYVSRVYGGKGGQSVYRGGSSRAWDVGTGKMVPNSA